MTNYKLSQADADDTKRAKAAALYATHQIRILPEPVGVLTHRELVAWAEFGYRLGWDPVILKTVDWLHAEWDKRMGKGRTA